MSEKKGEQEEESKTIDDSRDMQDDKKSKTKRESVGKKAKHNNVSEENNEDAKESDYSKATKSKKTAKKTRENENDKEEHEDDVKIVKKIPLLDQPPIIEGSRIRTCVLKPVPKGTVEQPRGKGKPLGKIPIVNQRLKRLRITTLKTLHRLIFGKIGKISLVLENIQNFKGFPYVEDSADYNKTMTAINKLHMEELKELIFSFDLDMKLKKKDECAKEILKFLISPTVSDKPQNPTTSHPKRKATKRNYFDADVEIKEKKKPKKSKASAELKKEKNSENDRSAKTSAKLSKTNDKSPKNDTSSKNDDDQDNTNELKKPAKKRKRNHIIDEEENKKSKQDEKLDNKKDDDVEDDDDEEESVTSDSSFAQKVGNNKDKLSDEELKIFLKKVLAELNLENTTMKTVYNLISSEYPTYDFSKKKRFIKGVVKSVIQ